jgi:RNA polymerase sigma factor (sigma-70 family)
MPKSPLTDVLYSLRHVVASTESATVPDAELLERFVRRRDNAAFELLVWRHGRMVHGLCRRILRHAHDAEDAFQATFLVLARRAASIRRRTTAGGWLYRVAYRIALDARARRARRAACQLPLGDAPTTVADPASEVARRELLGAIDAEVSRLPEKYRVPFVRCCCQGESTRALARELGCPAGTVESWLVRARRRLRAGLARRGVIAPAVPSLAPLGHGLQGVPEPVAALPVRLVAATVKAATTGPACTEVTLLTEGALKAMLLLRVKIAAVLFVALTVAGLGAGFLAPAGSDAAADGKQPSQTKPVSPVPAGRAQPEKKPAPGRIFAEVVFAPGLVERITGSNPSRIVAIDPETGKWALVAPGAAGGIVRVSPDARHVAFLRRTELWRCDLAGQEKPARLAQNAGRPCWSPDGKYLVHSPGEVVADGGWKSETWRLNADGTGAIRLKLPDTDSVEDWSPDGQWLLTCSDRHPPRGSGFQLYRMHPDGTAQRRLTQGPGLNCSARYSPDGRRIVYLHQERGVNSLHVMDADGTNDRVVVPSKGRTESHYACWSPDGKRLAVQCVTRPRPGAKDLFGNLLTDTYHLKVMDADGSHRRRLNLPDRDGDPIPLPGIGQVDWR